MSTKGRWQRRTGSKALSSEKTAYPHFTPDVAGTCTATLIVNARFGWMWQIARSCQASRVEEFADGRGLL